MGAADLAAKSQQENDVAAPSGRWWRALHRAHWIGLALSFPQVWTVVAIVILAPLVGASLLIAIGLLQAPFFLLLRRLDRRSLDGEAAA